MIDQAEAVRSAQDAIGSDCVLLQEHTREELFGWVFFYQSAAFVESGKISDALAGNAPLVVFRDSGEVRATGTARPLEEYLVPLRQEWWRRQG